MTGFGGREILKRHFPEAEYHVPLFDELGYVRKLCPGCGEYYWTLSPDQPTCGESTSKGCSSLRFIGNPPTRRRHTLAEMRNAFLSFFEGKGHARIEPYPVVSRWREDLYFTSASIVDFQPYVTNGIVPAPANPLVISQPCIRFVDVDNVGPTFGRHLTIFEMGGHHAFNYPDKEVYWKDQTVRYHHEFITQQLGVRPEEVVYKEDVWSGGGNAGPDLETIACGLELATLVFMKFKVVNNEFVELPIRTVDTGYGIERYTWLSQGSISSFHAIYGPILEEILNLSNISKVDNALLVKVAQQSGLIILDKASDRNAAREVVAKNIGVSVDNLNSTMIPVENAFAVADHTKCLVFMLAEGVVPSNVREGYLTRLMLRRTYRLLRTLGIEHKLLDIVDKQVAFWSKDFPYLREMRSEIFNMLTVEKEKYVQTLKKGGILTKRVALELKNRGIERMPTETLIELYDSHGLPPEIVAQTAEKEGISVKVPEDFYTMVAEQHVQAHPADRQAPTKELETTLTDLPPTRPLYYEDSYLTEFEAEVLKIIEEKYVVLDRTAFYPEGGGQPADLGHLKFDGKQVEVLDVQKVGNVIVHMVKGAIPKEGDTVTGVVNWKRRNSLMRHHTATHVIMGAARRVLGQHVWQAGAQKDVEASRVDISHFRRLTTEEIHKIEQQANEAVVRTLSVETSVQPRTEAEKQYGFRLYQGGAVPGRDIRVVRTGDWEVQACGGTHLKNTGEIGLIKILHTERVQDGVERIVFSAGAPALKAVQANEELLRRISEKLNAPLDKLETTTEKLLKEWKQTRREKERLVREIVAHEAGRFFEEADAAKMKDVDGLKFVTREFEPVDVDRMIQTASELVKREPKAVVVFYGKNDRTARVVVKAGKRATELGIDAREIANETALLLGGGGSGRTDFAQGGGTSVEKMPEALQKAEEIVRSQVQGRKQRTERN